MSDPRSHTTAQAEAEVLAPQNPSGDAGQQLVAAIAQAKTRIQAGDLEGGLAAFRQIAEDHPAIPEVFNNLGAICAAVGRRDEAEEAFGRAIELTPDSPNPWYNRGLMRFQAGKLPGAREDFERAVQLDPLDAEFHNNLGVAHFQMHAWEQARAAFETAISLRDDYVAAQLNRIDVDLAEGDVETAHARARALSAKVDDPDVQLKLIDCSVEAAVSALNVARRDCDSVESRSPEASSVLVRRRERIDQAEALLRETHAPTP